VTENTLHHIVYWLQRNRAVNLVLVFAYAAFICFIHDPLVKVSVVVMNKLSLPTYNQLVAVLSGIMLLLVLTYSGYSLYHYRERLTAKLFYLLTTVTLMAVHFRTMFEMNIEIVHSLEYTILAFLLYPLAGRYAAAIIFTVPFMLLDEWLQYRVFYPTYVEYFEFNDIMMDIYGSGMMMIFLLISGVKLGGKTLHVWHRKEFWAIALVLVVCFFAWQVCFIALYKAQQCENTWLVLNRIEGVQGFWRQYPGRDVIYHVMQPVEAFFTVPALLLFYFGLDGIAPTNNTTGA
jgi:hypothetical protein